MRFRAKNVIVTGGAQGIGRGIAEGFVNEGARVVIGDINLAQAENTSREIASSKGLCFAAYADMGNISMIKSFVNRAVEFLGSVDILVNNAGICTKEELFDLTPEQWDRTININLKGPLFLSQQVARLMVQNRTGRIVNVASTSSFVASSQCMIPYDVSKAGIKMLTQAMAVQLAPYGITVNAVAPGSTRTNLLRQLTEDPDNLDRFSSSVPMGRLGEPVDIARAVQFLSSEEASYITGHVLVVDGGYLLK